MHKCIASCSKHCAGKVKAGEFHRKSDLQKKIVDLIKNDRRYLTKQEILDGIKISSKTLTTYNVSVLECNRIAGFKKPSRIFENMILSILQERFVVETEVKFSNCLSPKGALLRFDFYLRGENVLIEADGSQHKDGHPWYRSYNKECDEIKDAWARKQGIHLIRIPYSKRVSKQYVFQFLEVVVATT